MSTLDSVDCRFVVDVPVSVPMVDEAVLPPGVMVEDSDEVGVTRVAGAWVSALDVVETSVP